MPWTLYQCLPPSFLSQFELITFASFYLRQIKAILATARSPTDQVAQSLRQTLTLKQKLLVLTFSDFGLFATKLTKNPFLDLIETHYHYHLAEQTSHCFCSVLVLGHA